MLGCNGTVSDSSPEIAMLIFLNVVIAVRKCCFAETASSFSAALVNRSISLRPLSYSCWISLEILPILFISFLIYCFVFSVILTSMSSCDSALTLCGIVTTVILAIKNKRKKKNNFFMSHPPVYFLI